MVTASGRRRVRPPGPTRISSGSSAASVSGRSHRGRSRRSVDPQHLRRPGRRVPSPVSRRGTVDGGIRGGGAGRRRGAPDGRGRQAGARGRRPPDARPGARRRRRGAVRRRASWSARAGRPAGPACGRRARSRPAAARSRPPRPGLALLPATPRRSRCWRPTCRCSPRGAAACCGSRGRRPAEGAVYRRRRGRRQMLCGVWRAGAPYAGRWPARRPGAGGVDAGARERLATWSRWLARPGRRRGSTATLTTTYAGPPVGWARRATDDAGRMAGRRRRAHSASTRPRSTSGWCSTWPATSPTRSSVLPRR